MDGAILVGKAVFLIYLLSGASFSPTGPKYLDCTILVCR